LFFSLFFEVLIYEARKQPEAEANNQDESLMKYHFAIMTTSARAQLSQQEPIVPFVGSR
jgi:hypothetical protein